MNNLELRMYGLVNYNISPIQQGIQFGHAVVDYGQKMKYLGEHKQSLNTQYNDWADNYKTFIILNGGTTNNKIKDDVYLGSLNNHKETLEKKDWEQWVDLIGGRKNLELRNFLVNFRLA